MSEKAYKDLSKRYHLGGEQIKELLELLQEDVGAPHILRYRKDLAANLTCDDLDVLRRENRRLANLERERRSVLKKLEEQGVLAAELEQRIRSAETIGELIDYYVPFRPQKRSRSRLALAQGLEPLARQIFVQDDPIPLLSVAAGPHVNPEKGLADVGEVLDGTFHIICDWIAEEKSHRDRQRKVLMAHGHLVAWRSGKSTSRSLRGEFREYFNFGAHLRDVHPCQVLCLMRGKRLKALNYSVKPPVEQMWQTAADLYMGGGAEQFSQIDVGFHETQDAPKGAELGELSGVEFLYWCIRHSLANVLVPILTREAERRLREQAQQLAVDVIKRNLRAQLMARPLQGHRVLGISPGYRTGCKLAALDQNGAILETTIVYPHTPRFESDEAKAVINRLVQAHDLTVAVVGDGTASQETENLIADLIRESSPDLRYVVLSERGAEVYAGSTLAAKELPGLDPGLRAAVSLGRQVLDPLCESTKVGLRELCCPRYVQELEGSELDRITRRTAEECVAEVGPDLNTAPRSLLKYVPELDSALALEIVTQRDQKGPFANRSRLRDVPKVDEAIWRETVGFLRVSNSDSPLDATRVHPDYYPVAMAILGQLGVALADLTKQDTRDEIARRRGEVKLADLEKQFDVHYLYLKDVLDELVAPWPDPRLAEEGPMLLRRQLTLDDIQPGQTLYGSVRKVVDFGAFVDVGVSEDGLVHISELSDRFVENPYDVVCVGDTVKVRVVDVDPEKRRIALSMRPGGSEAAARRRARPRRQAAAQGKPAERRTEARLAPAHVSKSAVQAPQSTVGKDSRRMKKFASFSSRQKPEQAEPSAEKKLPQGEEQKEEEPRRVALPELLSKVDFASIEKRGQQKG